MNLKNKHHATRATPLIQRDRNIIGMYSLYWAHVKAGSCLKFTNDVENITLLSNSKKNIKNNNTILLLIFRALDAQNISVHPQQPPNSVKWALKPTIQSLNSAKLRIELRWIWMNIAILCVSIIKIFSLLGAFSSLQFRPPSSCGKVVKSTHFVQTL